MHSRSRLKSLRRGRRHGSRAESDCSRFNVHDLIVDHRGSNNASIQHEQVSWDKFFSRLSWSVGSSFFHGSFFEILFLAPQMPSRELVPHKKDPKSDFTDGTTSCYTSTNCNIRADRYETVVVTMLKEFTIRTIEFEQSFHLNIFVTAL